MSDEKCPDRKVDFSHYRPPHFEAVEKRIAAGRAINPEDLAYALRTRGDAEIPASVIDHVCELLETKMPKLRGRPPGNKARAIVDAVSIPLAYETRLGWLQKRVAMYGHVSMAKPVMKASLYRYQPHELAARMTCPAPLL